MSLMLVRRKESQGVWVRETVCLGILVNPSELCKYMNVCGGGGGWVCVLVPNSLDLWENWACTQTSAWRGLRSQERYKRGSACLPVTRCLESDIWGGNCGPLFEPGRR